MIKKQYDEAEGRYVAPRLDEKEIISIVERNLPEFAKACEEKDAEFVMMTQAAFATDYLMGEFLMLGLAIKYAGMKGKELRIIP